MLKKLFEKKTEYVKIYNKEFLGNFKVLKKLKTVGKFRECQIMAQKQTIY